MSNRASYTGSRASYQRHNFNIHSGKSAPTGKTVKRLERQHKDERPTYHEVNEANLKAAAGNCPAMTYGEVMVALLQGRPVLARDKNTTYRVVTLRVQA